MRFTLSDESLNVYGSRVLTQGIDLAKFRRNPVMLYGHDRKRLPIGRWENIKVSGGKLTADPVFDDGDEFAQDVKRKVEGGFLRAASIGFNVLESSDKRNYLLPGQTRPTVIKSELVEASIVDIPANGNALAEVRLYERGEGIALAISGQGIDHLLPKLTSNMERQSYQELAQVLGMEGEPTYIQLVLEVNNLKQENNRLKAELAQANRPMAPVPGGSVTELMAQFKRSSASVNRDHWTLSDWRKLDPDGLRQRMKSDSEFYDKLYQKEFHLGK